MTSGQLFTDNVFTPNNDALYWADYPRPSSYSLQWMVPYTSWSRPMQRYTGVSLYGTSGISGNDIIQGSLNDCYILSPSQGMAEK